MTRILLLYYSQSGEAARVADALAASLQTPEVELVVERLRPRVDYPFPWKSIGAFFDVLPECHLGPLPELEPPVFDPAGPYDLVILVYQVWFLAPSLPVQSFLQAPAARVLRGGRVMTISVSRSMWHSAGETMKEMLAQAGARHLDHAALTHQGPAWATFITTPRALLFGKKGRFGGVLPAAGLGDAELQRVTRLGAAILRQRQQLSDSAAVPFWGRLAPAPVNHRYLLPDLLGWYAFRAWAHLLKLLTRLGPRPRRAGVYLFVLCLIYAIALAIPLSMLVRLLVYPMMRRWTAAYARRLEQPSGP